MMKNIKYIIILLFVAAFNYACENDDSIERRGKPAITGLNKTVTVTEGETATFDLEVDYAVANPINIRIDVLDDQGNPLVVTLPSGAPDSGNGLYDLVTLEDVFVPYNTWFESGYFQYGYTGGTGYIANFPAGQTSLQINIETLQDFIPNDTKIVNLKFTSTNLLEATIDEVVSINIENFVSNSLITHLDWSGDYLDNGINPCDGDTALDLDLELYYNGAFTDFSYSECPEELTILDTDPDGTYEIDASFWTSNGNTSSTVTNVPTTIIFTKPGIFYQEVDISSVFPLADGGLSDGNSSAITTFTVTKTGTTYTVTDSNNTQIAQGRNSNYRITKTQKKQFK